MRLTITGFLLIVAAALTLVVIGLALGGVVSPWLVALPLLAALVARVLIFALAWLIGRGSRRSR